MRATRIAMAAALMAGMMSNATALTLDRSRADLTHVESVAGPPHWMLASFKSYSERPRRGQSRNAALTARRSALHQPEHAPQRGDGPLGSNTNYDYYKDWHEACCF